MSFTLPFPFIRSKSEGVLIHSSKNLANPTEITQITRIHDIAENAEIGSSKPELSVKDSDVSSKVEQSSSHNLQASHKGSFEKELTDITGWIRLLRKNRKIQARIINIITVYSGGPLFCNFRTRKSYKIRGTLQNKGNILYLSALSISKISKFWNLNPECIVRPLIL